MANGYRLFLQEFWSNFHTTGSIAPSGKALAAALTRHVPRSNDGTSGGAPRRVLEVGPGTGAVTATLVKRLPAGDSLTLVELNDRFVAHLHDRFQTEPTFRAVSDRTEIVHDRLENLCGNQPFDVIVSGLPLNNFSSEAVEQILQTLEQLLAPGGRLSFFEYIAVRAARQRISRGSERQRLEGITSALHGVFSRHQHQREWVWPNVPPAWVHHLQKSVSA